MSLAIFDLDNTLLGDDSDYLWGQFLVEQQLVGPEAEVHEGATLGPDLQLGEELGVVPEVRVGGSDQAHRVLPPAWTPKGPAL